MNKNTLFQAIILAAGRGSRMGSDLPKVLIPVCGRPMIEFILDALTKADIKKPIVVVGSGDAIRNTLSDRALYAVQDEPRGSGHAVMCAADSAGDASNILVMCGDSPLFTSETVQAIVKMHIESKATITLACAILGDPSGYGRILRNPDGTVSGVVEEKLATEQEKSIQEINGGCYAFDAAWLWGNIDLMKKNEVGEYCLTEMVDIAISQGNKVVTVTADESEVLGINTPTQLAEAEAILRSRGLCE